MMMVAQQLTSFSWTDYIITLIILWIGLRWWIQIQQQQEQQQEEHEQQQVDNDTLLLPPFFQSCPNPNCIRCQKYNMVNELAQQRLRLLRILPNDSAQRVIEAVQTGPLPLIRAKQQEEEEKEHEDLQTDNKKKMMMKKIYNDKNNNNHQNATSSSKEVTQTAKRTTTTIVAPCTGQYPNVLLVPRLWVVPYVTCWHERACAILEQHAHEIWLEYQAALGISRIQQQQMKTIESTAETAKTTTAIARATTTNALDPTTTLQKPLQAPIPMTTTKTTEADNQSSLLLLDNDVPQGQWQALHLLNQGQWQENVLHLCPQTTRLIQHDLLEHTHVMAPQYNDKNNEGVGSSGSSSGCVFANIFFSVLQPGTVIEPHCGPCNIRHRLHLTLQSGGGGDGSGSGFGDSTNVDDDDNVVNTNKKKKKNFTPTLFVQGCEPQQPWQQVGKAFVFDDSLVHSVSYPNHDDDDDNDYTIAASFVQSVSSFFFKTLSSSSSLPPPPPQQQRVVHTTTTTTEPCSHPPLLSPRVVLVVDLWHPGLTVSERQLLTELYQSSSSMSSTTREARK